MKATKVNTMVWTASAIALVVHATAQGWDAAFFSSSPFFFFFVFKESAYFIVGAAAL